MITSTILAAALENVNGQLESAMAELTRHLDAHVRACYINLAAARTQLLERSVAEIISDRNDILSMSFAGDCLGYINFSDKAIDAALDVCTDLFRCTGPASEETTANLMAAREKFNAKMDLEVLDF
jgi:hypothetical protein